MSKQAITAHLHLKAGAGERTVKRDQVLKAMEEADEKKLPESRNGWSVEENGKRYDPKWLLKLATGEGITKFTHAQARATLSVLGFTVHSSAENIPEEDDEAEEPKELTFDIERNLQEALRANIEQLEVGLKITDGGKEKDHMDIRAEDKNGATVVIELKVGEAGRRSVGQILGYMGELATTEKKVRGILVARDFDSHAVAATRVIPTLQLRKYTFKFKFDAVAPK